MVSRTLSQIPIWIALLCTLGVIIASPHAQGSEPLDSGAPTGPMKVSITVDDLPEHDGRVFGVTREEIAHAIIKALKDNDIEHVYGFANGYFMRYQPEEVSILKDWLLGGHSLGNHTFGHLDLNHFDADFYIADIVAEQSLLQKLEASVGRQDRLLFRYPYLDEGDDLSKRNRVRDYLAKNGYQVAQVTADYEDWAWNRAYSRCVSQNNTEEIEWLKAHVAESSDTTLRNSKAIAELLFGRDVPHILLIHMSYFNAVILGSLLKHWRAKWVEFVQLDETLKDPIYRTNPNLAYSDGLTFLEQIARARGVDIRRFQGTTVPFDFLNKMCNPRVHN